MAFSHSKIATFSVQDSGGTLRDISAYLTSGALSREADTAEVSTLGSTAKSYVAGLVDATISIEGKFDPVVDGYLFGIINPPIARNFELQPVGPGTGNIRFSGSCIPTKYEPGADIGDAVQFSAEFQVTGAITRTVL